MASQCCHLSHNYHEIFQCFMIHINNHFRFLSSTLQVVYKPSQVSFSLSHYDMASNNINDKKPNLRSTKFLDASGKSLGMCFFKDNHGIISLSMPHGIILLITASKSPSINQVYLELNYLFNLNPNDEENIVL
jgi:hypothetical protein